MLQAQSCDPCAESSLSNLTATAIDVSLLPASDATVDIGGSSGNFDWADIYLQKVIHFDIGADFNNEDVLELNGNSFLHVTGGSYDGLFLGEYAGVAATSSNHGMVGIGHKALETITGSAGHNTSVGWYSSSLMTSGGKNTLMGSRAGQNITTGSSNTGVGHNVFYRSGMDITYQGIVTVAADVASALSFKVRYTDADITSGTVDVPSTNITGNNSTTSNTVGSANFSGVVIIQVADITDIKYIVSRASENTESMEYSLRVILERIQ